MKLESLPHDFVDMYVRSYRPDDYRGVKALYQDPSTFGGQFDENRDTQEKLDQLIGKKSGAILVAEVDGAIRGTVTIFEDGRSCWLYRFAVANNDQAILDALLNRAKEVAKELGHSQFLVFAPAGGADFEKRYQDAGFNKGGDYTCFWMNI